MKKFISLIIGLAFTFGLMVNANAAEVPVKDFTELKACLTSATENTCKIAGAVDNTIKITDADVIANGLTIVGKKTLNLNGATITSTGKGFIVNGGNLRVEGEGTIEAAKVSIRVVGSSNENANNYSVLYVGPKVTIIDKQYSVIVLFANGTKVSYGVDVTIDGSTLKAAYGGAYINGDAKNTVNAPIIRINDNSTLVATGDEQYEGVGIYGAGYANWIIGKANISGTGSGLAIKSGKWVIDGAEVTATGVGEIPTEGFSNGINASGAAIQIESNRAYAGEIDLTINSGKFESTHSYAFYEYLDLRTKDDKGNTLTPTKETKVAKLAINGGEFISNSDIGKIFLVSEQLDSKIKDSTKIGKFITGGTFTGTVPAEYVATKADYTAVDAALVEAGKVDKTKYTAESYAKLTDAIDKVERDLDFTRQKFVDGYATAITNAIKLLVKLEEPVAAVPEVDVTEKVEEIAVGVSDKEATEELLLEELAKSDIETDGKNVAVSVDIYVFNEEEISESTLGAITDTAKEKLNNAVIGGYFDVSISVFDKNTGSYLGALTDLNKSVKLSVVLPEELKTVAEGYNRTYYIIRNHGDKTDIITPTLSKDGNSLEFESNKFSTLAIAYEDAKKVEEEVPKTYDGIYNYVGLALISLLGLGLSVKALVKKED